jgi:hypothetical protein
LLRGATMKRMNMRLDDNRVPIYIGSKDDSQRSIESDNRANPVVASYNAARV